MVAPLFFVSPLLVVFWRHIASKIIYALLIARLLLVSHESVFFCVMFCCVAAFIRRTSDLRATEGGLRKIQRWDMTAVKLRIMKESHGDTP